LHFRSSFSPPMLSRHCRDVVIVASCNRISSLFLDNSIIKETFNICAALLQYKQTIRWQKCSNKEQWKPKLRKYAAYRHWLLSLW
jgi:hypothetical protein